MKVNKAGLIGIGIGIIVFILLVTFPIWYAGGKSKQVPQIDLNTPVINSLPEKQCVAPTAFMKTRHMKLLDEWRNDVVRNNNRTYTTPDGRRYDKSLTKTCMQCHSNKEQFCNRCHNYAGVNPKCWDCHSESAPRNTKTAADFSGRRN
jgi:hypothetical protein